MVTLRLLMQMSMSLNDALNKKTGKMPLKHGFFYCQEQKAFKKKYLMFSGLHMFCLFV